MKMLFQSKINLLFLIMLLVTLGCYMIIPNSYLSLLSNVPKTMKLIASVRAKDFCSCYLAQKLSQSYCYKWAAKGLPEFISPIQINSRDKTISSGVYYKAQATYTGKHSGCELVQ